MDTRGVGIEDAVFGALFALRLSFIIPQPVQPPPLITTALSLIAATLIITIFVLALQAVVSEKVQRKFSLGDWAKLLGAIFFCSLLLPAVLQVSQTSIQTERFIPLPILMIAWIAVRLWCWPYDGEDGGGETILASMLLAMLALLIIVYGSLAATVVKSTHGLSPWLIDGMVAAVTLPILIWTRSIVLFARSIHRRGTATAR